jgi:hypothetical protein
MTATLYEVEIQHCVMCVLLHTHSHINLSDVQLKSVSIWRKFNEIQMNMLISEAAVWDNFLTCGLELQ